MDVEKKKYCAIIVQIFTPFPFDSYLVLRSVLVYYPRLAVFCPLVLCLRTGVVYSVLLFFSTIIVDIFTYIVL